MGNSTSTSKEKKQEEIIDTKNIVDGQTNQHLEQNNNLKKIMPKEEDNDTTEILESLDITEFKKPDEKESEFKKSEETKPEKKEQVGGKKSIPLLGGYGVNGVNLTETSDDIFGGLENKTGRKRYTKYDLFKILRDLDVDTEAHQQGGGNDETDVKSSSNDEKSMEHIKNIILKELETLKTNKSQQLGGSGCGCDGSGDKNKNTHKLSSKLNLNNIIIDNEGDKQLGGTVIIDASSSSTTSDDSETSSSELGYGKTKKSKSSKKSQSQVSDDSDSHFHIDTTESGLSDREEQTSNGESDEKIESEKSSEIKRKKKDKTDSEEGLSIFPFNSSDVKSSISIKNYRMLRRKI